MEIWERVSSLREAVAAVDAPCAGDLDDYRIATAIGPAFLGRGRNGMPTLLIPLATASETVGRHGGGFSLTPTARVAFHHDERRWEQAAAILACTDEGLADTFLILVLDIARRLTATSEAITWSRILAWVEDWQSLLGRRGALTTQEQLGLWGELWVMSKAAATDQLFAAWRGPEREPVDFFYDGKALEVKVSQRAHVHYVSQTQVDAPRGRHDAFVLSIWVGLEPVRGTSLGELIDVLLARVSDPAALLRALARARYSPLDRAQYATRYLTLEAPRWFPAEGVPRVRQIEAGISQLRYLVTLDIERSLDRERAIQSWQHFCHIDPASADDLVGPA
jgi:hypothetical protein